MSGVLCDTRVPPHVKGKIHKVIVQPAMPYGMETVPVTSSHVKKLEVTEMKMCRWACGHTLTYHVRNDDIRERLDVGNITEMCRKARLRWFDHVKRRDQEYVGRKTRRRTFHVVEIIQQVIFYTIRIAGLESRMAKNNTDVSSKSIKRFKKLTYQNTNVILHQLVRWHHKQFRTKIVLQITESVGI